MFIKRPETSIASRPEVNQRSTVVVGPGFFFGIIQPALVTPLTAALEPFVRDKRFTFVAGKQPKPTGGIEFKPMNIPTRARAAIINVLSTNQFVIHIPTQFTFGSHLNPCLTIFLRVALPPYLSTAPRRKCSAHLAPA
jgi:hypothetical protein